MAQDEFVLNVDVAWYARPLLWIARVFAWIARVSVRMTNSCSDLAMKGVDCKVLPK